MLKVRTGYSFRSAAGHLEEVMSRLVECGSTVAPITDTSSTFGWARWDKLAKKNGLKPVFGVELAVSRPGLDKKPAIDYWTFLAKEDIGAVNRLVELATLQFSYQPTLTMEQAMSAEGVFKITGTKPLIDGPPGPDCYLGLSPAINKMLLRNAIKHGWPLAATSENRYAREADKPFYEILAGRFFQNQTYPQHLMTGDEWYESVSHMVPYNEASDALATSKHHILFNCRAELRKAKLPHFSSPETLEEICRRRARETGFTALQHPEYEARLMRELKLIEEKGYEDYFFIVGDIVRWARDQMMVGPARGSSCGSLVCFLLGITTVDPIPYGLIFERFVDINRSDMPDIDIDFSDQQRHMVFEYIIEKYGREVVARLGTVALYRPRSALQEVGAGLQIPKWKCDAVADALIERSSGDSRALSTLEDTLASMPAGIRLIEDHPEAIIMARFEGHPRHYSQHAAGVVIADRPITDFVAVDHRTGATMCDKKDAEDAYNLLKIDALGLTQLSIFEDALELAGLPRDHLEKLPLDDLAAFEVLNRQKWSGIFQFNGLALQGITKQFKIDCFNDIVSVTALGRPGPLASGGAGQWVQRRNGAAPVTYPHPLFEPYLKDTLGIVVYQEQVMEICRNIGGLGWGEVTALRKAMSKSLGKEYFDQFGDPWKKGAIEKGVAPEAAEKVWDELCAYGAWCLSGDTVLRNPHPNQYNRQRTFTLKELFESQGLAPGKKQKGGRRQKILSWDGQGLKPAPTVDVFFSGVKKTYEVTTKCGKKIRATLEHAFLTPDGFFQLKDLEEGSQVAIASAPTPTARKAKTGTGSGRHNWREAELKGEAFYNGVRGSRKKVVEASPMCTECQAWPTEEVHHIDGNHKNHDLQNLQAVCRTCHKKLHRELFGQDPKAWDKGLGTEWAEIASIGDPREEETYDISMPAPNHNFLANDFVVHNSFNKSHSVAYGLISYWCCWLKAHFPAEFAAATLSHENDTAKQIKALREVVAEGNEYVPVDAELSGKKWTVKNQGNNKLLVGPLWNVKGLGPKLVSGILGARARGEPISDRAKKLLTDPKTSIDSLFPIRDAINRVMPDRIAKNILTEPTDIVDVKIKARDYDVVVLCTFMKIGTRDENEAVNVAKRGYEIKDGKVISLNLQMEDDTDIIFGKIDRHSFEKLGRPIVERGRPRKSLYAVKGTVRGGSTFRMINIKSVKYLGDADEEFGGFDEGVVTGGESEGTRSDS
jgi:DNA polymerase III alpha subunit